MNTEPKPTQEPRSSFQEFLRQLPGRIAGMLSRNWPWKLLSLFLAVCLWAGLISQDPTLTRERVFSDVQMGVTGESSLINNGFIVISGLEEENRTARLVVDVPQREYTTASPANYNPRVDLSRITSAGEQTLRVITTSSTTYGSVQSVTPSSIQVMVDEYVTNYRIPVFINVSGSYPEGFYGGGITANPSVVAVSGPRSVVDEITRISVDFDLSRLSPRAGQVRSAVPMRFLDRNGNELDSELLEVASAGLSLRTIIVEQTLYPTRMIDLSTADLTTGEPADGYRVASVSISPASLLAAGSEDALAAVEELILIDPVDVTDARETFTKTVRAQKPSDLTYLSAESITVTVEIEEEIMSRTYEGIKLSVRGTGAELKASLGQRTATLVLTGPKLLLENLRASKLSAYADATGLGAGEHELPIELHVEETDMSGLSFAATPSTVSVTLTEK